MNTSPFSEVPAGLGPALAKKGFTSLTTVQTAVLAEGLHDRDLRIFSQTGSGKTVALGFALAEGLAADERRPQKVAAPAALMVAPTRELAAQIREELTWLFAPLSARVEVVTGGTPMHLDFRMLRQNPAVLVGTPGRLLDHLTRGSLDLSQLSTVVLDEADRMLDMGFREDIDAILAACPEERRTHMVSATFPPEVHKLALRFQRNPAEVEGTRAGKANEAIEHEAMVVAPRDRIAVLTNLLLLAPADKTLIFVRTRADAADFGEALARQGMSVMPLSGDMSQRERTATLGAFKLGRVDALVATDVAARGLDVNDIKRVIHVDIPSNREDFTHRSGRTGRAGKTGRSIVFVPPKAMRYVGRLFRSIGVKPMFRDPPTPADVRKRADERLVEQVTAQELSEKPRLHELARRLLETHDPHELVVKLLARSKHSGPCAARELPKHSARMPRDDYDRSRGPARGGGTGDWVSFQLSYGRTHGADPSSILAIVCRRGGVTRHNVGSIQVGQRSSRFEISTQAARAFAEKAQKPCTRDPRIKIRPWLNTGPESRPVMKKGNRPHHVHPKTGRRLQHSKR